MTTPTAAGTYWTPALTQTAVKTSAYTALPNQLVPVSTAGGAVTITLPTGTPAGSLVAVKMVTQSGTNAVTITSVAGDVFNKAGGSTTLTLSLLNQGVVLEYQAGIWLVLADDLALSGLDSRYVASVTAADTSVVTGGTAAAVTVRTGTLDVVAAQHPPAADWSNNSHKITALANGSAAADAAAFGQVPVIGGTTFGPVLLGPGSLSAAQTANLLVMHVICIPVAITVTGLVVANGGTAAGNVLAGLYNAAGASLLASSASTAQTGTSTTQLVPFTGTFAAAAGTYIAAVLYSSSSATAPAAYSATPASTAAQGGFSLPASVTPPTAAATAALAVAATY